MTFENRHLIIGTIAMSILATTAASWAQSTTAGPASAPASSTSSEKMALFDKADINKDGKLSKVEARSIAGLVANFESVDLDGDQMVSKEEFQKAIQ
jgi:hypothetical protein